MSELSEQAQAALSALREDTASSAQKDRVRARLLALGVVAGGSGVAAVASAAAGSSLGASTVGAVPASGAIGSAAAAAPTSAAVVSSSALSGGAVSGAAAAKLGALGALTAKLASVPVALKVAAVVAVVGTSAALPLTRSDTPAAAIPVAQAPASSTPARAERLQPVSDVAMKLDVPAVREPVAPAPVAEPKVEPLVSPAPSSQALRAHRKLLEGKRPAPASVEEVASSLAVESALLADALRALRAGDFSRAALLLNEHEQRFASDALLAPERERMRRELAARQESARRGTSPD